MKEFQVYVIHSTKPINQLTDLLDSCGGCIHAGIIYRSSRSQHGPKANQISTKEETNKTIVFCSSETIEQLKQNHPEFDGHVEDYNWSSFPNPKPETGETWDLHISGVPNDYTNQEAARIVIDAFSCILPEVQDDHRNFSVDFPPRLRETGEINGYGKVVFEDHVDREIIKHCKLILHNTPLTYKMSKERRMINCIWHRDPKSIPAPRLKFENFEAEQPSQKSDEGFSSIRRARPDRSSTAVRVPRSSQSLQKVTKDGVVSGRK